MKRKLLVLLFAAAAMGASAFAGCNVEDNSANIDNGNEQSGYYDEMRDGLKYRLSHYGFYAVVGLEIVNDADIIIANEIDGIPVKSIAGLAFSGCSSLTSVKLENGQQQKILKAANQ